MNFKLYSFNLKDSQKRVNLGTPFSFHNSDPKVIDVLFLCRYPLALSSLPRLIFFLDVYLGCHQLSAAGIHT